MKKILTIAVIFAFAFSVLPMGSASALAPGDWQIVGSHALEFGCGGGTYAHTLTDGFPGSGTYDANNAYTWDMTGDITGDTITFAVVYTGINAGYTLNGVGTIAPDGSISGTVDNNCQTFAMPAGTATKVTSGDILAMADSYIHGGGHALNGDKSIKRKDRLDVSFGGWLAQVGSDLIGEWQVNLHNVANNDLDKGKFHATEFTAFNLYGGDSSTCNDAVNLTALGTFNGEEGYKMIFRAGDNGSPNTEDTVRVELYHPTDGMIFDTKADIGGESSCVGSARSLLDTGNITIYNP